MSTRDRAQDADYHRARSIREGQRCVRVLAVLIGALLDHVPSAVRDGLGPLTTSALVDAWHIHDRRRRAAL